MLYEVAMIERTVVKDKPTTEKIVLLPTCILANDPQGAAIQAVMTHKRKLPDDMSSVEVLVRPFVNSK
jgi:hypothetical protein